MKKSRFTETQIVSILKEADNGIKGSDLCRQHGISQPTYYNWKSKYGGLSVSELKRIKEPEAEHSKLKRMYADLAMENDVLKELLKKRIYLRIVRGRLILNMNTLQNFLTFLLILLCTLAANVSKEENVMYRIKGQEDTGELIISTDYLPLGKAGDGLTVIISENKGNTSGTVNCGYLLEEIFRQTLDKYPEETKKNEKNLYPSQENILIVFPY